MFRFTRWHVIFFFPFFPLSCLYSTHFFVTVTIIVVCTDDGSKYNRILYTRKVFPFFSPLILVFWSFSPSHLYFYLLTSL